MKLFLKTIYSILISFIVGILIWSCLYLFVPTIKEKTNNLFGWNNKISVEISIDKNGYDVPEPSDDSSIVTGVFYYDQIVFKYNSDDEKTCELMNYYYDDIYYEIIDNSNVSHFYPKYYYDNEVNGGNSRISMLDFGKSFKFKIIIYTESERLESNYIKVDNPCFEDEKNPDATTGTYVIATYTIK